jgi:hypothetical protein
MNIVIDLGQVCILIRNRILHTCKSLIVFQIVSLVVYVYLLKFLFESSYFFKACIDVFNFIEDWLLATLEITYCVLVTLKFVV